MSYSRPIHRKTEITELSSICFDRRSKISAVSEPEETILHFSFHALHPRHPEKKLVFSPDNFADKNIIDSCMCMGEYKLE